MRVQLIANPVAGRGAQALIERARERLLDSGHDVELFLTSRAGDAEQFAPLAVSGGFDRIVVAGGDGTINEVVNGMTADSPPLAILPLGTTNVLALEIGIPRLLAEQCDLAMHGKPTLIHLGKADQRRFTLMAGVGFDAAVVHGVNLRLKRALGKGAYLASTCRCWLHSPSQPVQVVDESGQTHHGYGAIISNARSYGGRFTMTPRASLFADTLEVCLILRPGRLALLRVGLALLTGRPLPHPWGRHFRSRKLEVRGEGVPVQIDGDEAGFLPRVFSVNPFPIRLMLPKE
ncbi:MAG: diacylglycerol kinase family lipid kinase [Desulfobulbaceae bacterium]|nr:diacylglycerol kinase family lipid kinase [Desulfobulbaceae bacterium]